MAEGTGEPATLPNLPIEETFCVQRKQYTVKLADDKLHWTPTSNGKAG